MILAIVAFVGFMQVGPPVTWPPLQPPAPLPGEAPAPAPGPGATQPGTPSPGPQAQVWTATSYGDLLYDGSAHAAQRLGNEGFETLGTFWNLPDFLMNSRRAENTADQPDAADLNDSMVLLIPGLMLAAMALVTAANVVGSLKSGEVNPLGVLVALSIVTFMGFVAINNRMLQHYLIDLANLLLGAISGAPIRDYAAPGAHIYNTGSLMWTALVGIGFLLLMLALTVVMFIEGAWCIVLGSQLGILLLGSATPFFGSPSVFLIRRWMGSLFSPVLVLTALKLMSSVIANLPTGTPDVGRQFLMLAFAIVAWQAPGVMVGAISVAFPGLAQIYFAGRLFGNTWRPSDAALPRGGGDGGSSGNTAVRDDPPRAQAPRNATPGQGGRVGGGTAVTNRGLPPPRRV